MGNFPIWPQVGCAGDNFQNCDVLREKRGESRLKESAQAYPGYFSIDLLSGIKAEMTVSNHSALYRFTFPKAPKDPLTGPLSPHFSLSLEDLPNTMSKGVAQVDPKTGRMTGNGTFEPSFGLGQYSSHFCMDFKGAEILDTGVWVSMRAGNKSKIVKTARVNGNNERAPSAGTWVQFKAPSASRQILVRAGMSFISSHQACQNAEREIPDYDFAKLVSSAKSAWEEKLSVIEVDPGGIREDLLKTFWSGIYRAMISPQDYTGENPLWKSAEPYYDSFYCIWDSFRSIHPLLTIIDPQSQTRMVRSLIDIYRHEGKMPDCRMTFCKGSTQGGSNADTVLVDSWLKGIGDDVDWEEGYKAMLSDAEDEPPNWSVEGRGGLESWKSLGYIPQDDFDPQGVGAMSRTISRTVEYAYNDFNIATMAKFTNRTADYEKYIERSGNWKNLFKADQHSSILGGDTGFVGYLQPRLANGTWAYQDPIVCSHESQFGDCYLNTSFDTYEGSPWLYTFYAPGKHHKMFGSALNFLY
jgi:putative alpha-1,2-mannosidase